jgi:hypothetical protein
MSNILDKIIDIFKSLEIISKVVLRGVSKTILIKQKKMIGGIGENKNTLPTIDDLSNQIKTNINEPLKNIISNYDKIVAEYIDYFTKGSLNIPFTELSPETINRINKLSDDLKEKINSPAYIKAVEDFSEVFGEIIIIIINKIEPSLNEVFEKVSIITEKMGKEAAAGATKTGVGIISAGVAEVPYIGGIIDLIVAFGFGFNAFMKVMKIFSKDGSIILQDMTNLTDELIETFHNNKDKLNKVYKDIPKLNSIPTNPIPTNPIPINNLNKSLQKGGGKVFKNLKHKRNKLTKRITNSLNRFINIKSKNKTRNK